MRKFLKRTGYNCGRCGRTENGECKDGSSGRYHMRGRFCGIDADANIHCDAQERVIELCVFAIKYHQGGIEVC